MLVNRVKDLVTRICDNCGHEQIVSYWNVYKKDKHLCRSCNNKKEGSKKLGKPVFKLRGERKPKKLGTFYINSQGYVCIWVGKHSDPNKVGGYYLEHRVVMELHLGRKLTEREHVHHIDGDKTNNTLENLLVCDSNFNHRKVHANLERIGYKLIRAGVIKFNRQTLNYELVPNSGDAISKLCELLENPNVQDEGNQQRSLRDFTSEERSEAIQKWSTLK